jgi:hypothetical protein
VLHRFPFPSCGRAVSDRDRIEAETSIIGVRRKSLKFEEGQIRMRGDLGIRLAKIGAESRPRSSGTRVESEIGRVLCIAKPHQRV